MKTLLYDLMAHPRVYLGIQNALGASRLRTICMEQFAKPQPGERVLDLGCGPGYILEYLPHVEYFGFDTEQRYIDYARKHYGARGRFHCEVFSEETAARMEQFDVILLMGLIHHIDDKSASSLLHLVSRSLKPHGRAVTLDPCFTDDQSRIARFVARSDRGRFVRTAEQYDSLAKPHFDGVSAVVMHNVCRIPSTERIMLLTLGRRPG